MATPRPQASGPDGGATTNGTPMFVQACLNGAVPRDAHLAVPLTPDEIARDARAAVAAGVGALHIHARQSPEHDTLDPAACAATLMAVRAACPGVPVGMTTVLSAVSAAPSAVTNRLTLVRAWGVLPDVVSVNIGEPGAAELCDLLRARGIGIEAGLETTDDARALLRGGLAPRCLRVLVEPMEADPTRACATAGAIARMLRGAGVALPQVHHGDGVATWAVMAAALDAGHDIRIGLEDTLVRPDGAPARDNAELVSLAMEMACRHGRTPALPDHVP